MGQTQFLQPIVEFIVKGQDAVMAAGKSIETKLKDMAGPKLSTITFTAVGTDKITAAVSTIKQKLAGLAAPGGDFVSMLAGGLGEAFTKAGEQAGGAIAGGLGSSLGGALSGAIGGLVVSAIPGLSEIIRGAMERNEEHGALLAGALAPEERRQYEEIEAREKKNWFASKGGFSGYGKGLQAFQDVNLSPEQAEAAMNQLMVLSEGGGLKGGVEGAAESYARMLAGKDPRHRVGLVRSSPVIMDALREMLPQYNAPGMEETLLENLSKGHIGSQDVAEAVRRAALNPRIVQRANEAKDVDTTGPLSAQNWRSTYRGIMQWGSDPGAALKDWLTSMPGTARSGPSVAELPGMGTVGNEAWQAHPEMGGRGEYQFVSLAGLAEKMQQEASGGLADMAARQLTVLEKIAANTAPKEQPSTGHLTQQQLGMYWH
jgi:hypothetical protein